MKEHEYNSIPAAILYTSVCAAALLLDRITKDLAVKHLRGKDAINLIGNIFQLTYVENRGAAFGVLQGRQIFFYIITVVICALIVYAFLKCPKTPRYTALLLTMTFIMAGALGNFIDRVSGKFVVDFIYFRPIDFPVFNVADIFITLGCIALAIEILFVYREEELSFLKSSRRKDETC